MSMEPLRICIVGLGRAGNFHLQSLRMMDEACVSCVYDPDMPKAEAVADRLGCAVAASKDEAIDRDDVDAVIVATPTDFHFEFVQQSLDARKPTLTEKPLGRHLHEIDDCFNKAKKCETLLFVAFQRRFDPSFSSLVRAVRDGEIGQLQFVARCHVTIPCHRSNTSAPPVESFTIAWSMTWTWSITSWAKFRST